VLGSNKAQLVKPPYGSSASWLEVGGQKMSDYLRALKALGWLNLNTDFRANNISEDYPQSYKQHVGGMFGLSKFSSKESLNIITGNDLVAVAIREGWEYE
jgi:hypothetical protein